MDRLAQRLAQNFRTYFGKSQLIKNNNTVINSQILFENIRRYVVANADQTPERAQVHKAGHDGGDFLFFPKE